MGFEEITIGKIKSPDVFYFVPVDEDHEVYNRQVKEMKEFVNLKEELENSVGLALSEPPKAGLAIRPLN